MSDEIIIGPNRCQACGGEYGEHRDWCAYRKPNPPPPPRGTARRELKDDEGDGCGFWWGLLLGGLLFWAAACLALAADSPLSHSAVGVGHYFARSSWEPDATFVAFQAGTYNQAHAHQSQGSFDLWGGGRWLTQTQNARTKSGIQQGTDWHNMLRFERDGVLVRQKYRGRAIATVTDDGDVWRAEAVMDGLYPEAGITWVRKITFARNVASVCLRDDWSAPKDVQAVWQLQLPVEPTINEAGSVLTAGRLRATIDRGGPISVKDWKSLSADAVVGWRVELRDGERQGFDVTLEVVP